MGDQVGSVTKILSVYYYRGKIVHFTYKKNPPLHDTNALNNIRHMTDL